MDNKSERFWGSSTDSVSAFIPRRSEEKVEKKENWSRIENALLLGMKCLKLLSSGIGNEIETVLSIPKESEWDSNFSHITLRQEEEWQAIVVD